MKKIINEPSNFVEECIEDLDDTGMLAFNKLSEAF